MSTQEPNSVVRYIRKLIGVPVSDRSDGELLQQFLTARDEKAFETLVDRHGPLVRGVCLRVLGNAADADDAFQATFLVLVRNAGSIRQQHSIAPWLHGVARRIAHKSRLNAARRRERENAAKDEPAAAPSAAEDMSWRELMQVVDEEVAALPEKYAAPLVLCCLQGKSRDEAAQELGCPVGSIKKRLEQGRELLRSRLVRRGLTLPATFFALTVLPNPGSAAVPASLLLPTVDAAVKFAASKPLIGVVSSHAVALANECLQGLVQARLKVAALTLLIALGIGGTSVGTIMYFSAGGPTADGGLASVGPTEPQSPISQPLSPEEFPPLPPDEPPGIPPEETETAPPPMPEDKTLREKLQGLEAEAVKVRQAMLQEIAAEEILVQEARKKAAEEYNRAVKAGDRAAASSAFQAMNKAQNDLLNLSGMRFDIQRRINVGTTAKTPSEEERLGIRTYVPSSAVAKQLGLPQGQGMVLNRVTADSAAARAGLQADDILLRLDGRDVPSDSSKFRKLLAESKPGAANDAVVLRQGNQQTIQGIIMPPAGK